MLNLYEYFELEKKNGGPLKHISSVQEAKDIISLCYNSFYRVAAALKISKKTVYTIRKRKNNSQELSTAGKKDLVKKQKPMTFPKALKWKYGIHCILCLKKVSTCIVV